MADLNPLLRSFDDAPPGVLPAQHRTVLLVIATMRAPLTCAQIAARAGLSDTRIYRTLRELEAARWLRREPRTREDGGRDANAYTITPHGGPILRQRRGTWPHRLSTNESAP